MTTRTGVKPIIGSTISWTELLKDVAELSGHSPTKGIDSYGYKLSEYARFLSVLGEFRSGKEQDPINTIQNAGDILDHLHFGFLIYGKTSLIFTIMERTDLRIITAKIKGGRAAIVTGTLRQWKNAIINILTNKVSGEVRWVFSYCYDTFQQLGLQGVWHDYRKQQVDKNTYLLEYKKP